MFRPSLKRQLNNYENYGLSGKKKIFNKESVKYFFFWKMLKKAAEIFSNFFIYLKVQSFQLIMENNFIQMATSAGQAVTYTIDTIFNHIIDCVSSNKNI